MSREGEALAVYRSMTTASLRGVLDERVALRLAAEKASPEADLVASAVGFCRTLRAAGSPVTPERAQRFVESLAALGHEDHDSVYWAGRLTLCADPDDLRRYDRAFGAYFSGEAPHRRATPGRAPAPRLVSVEAPLGGDDGGEDEDGEDLSLQIGASRTEVLRHRDIASLTPADRRVLARLLAAFSLPGEPRTTRRWRAEHGGSIDRHRTVRTLLRGMGEPARLSYQRHAERPRRIVLLVDVSGSMSAYADALLRFAHTAQRRRGVRTEVFSVGTRLTRLTRELAHRDVDSALAAVAGAIADWSGGTRLGDVLKEWLDRWGQRGMARGAVVVILSDGWERGDARLLGEQMARLQRLAHRVVWANPRKGRSTYAPSAAGMAAALPYVDDFVAGHSLHALERLARVVAGHA